jgi:gamma-glutamylputrescine oxidase
MSIPPPAHGLSRTKESGDLPESYYEATVTRPPICAPLGETIAVDVGVVGGGYSGISAALELAQRGFSVALLEAQRIGWGASGRNGGQVLVGLGSEGECGIEEQFSLDVARRAWDISVEGTRLVKERIEAHAIECEYRKGYLHLVVKPRRWPALERWATHVMKVYEYPLQFIGPDEIGNWVASRRFHSAVFDAGSGHLHPLKYCLGLAAAARRAGVRVYEQSAVLRMDRGARPVLKTRQGAVMCRFVLLAGNVYLDEFGVGLAPELGGRIMPVGTHIVATQPMGKVRADALMAGRPAASDTNYVLDYFRVSADHRFLFGGGESHTARMPRGLMSRMRRRMLDVFPQLSDLSITHAWGGLVDITLNQAPDFGRLQQNIYYLQGFSGHGLAMSGIAGKLAAEAIAGDAERFDIFARIKHRRFPGGALLRKPAAALGLLYYRMLDLL